MQKAFIILKAAAIALIAAACAQGPLHLSKSLWVVGNWASGGARSVPTFDPAEIPPPAADLAGPVSAPREP